MECKGTHCSAAARCVCSTCEFTLCFECFKEHLGSSEKSSHLVSGLKENCLDEIDPLELLCKRVPLSTAVIRDMKKRGVTIQCLLKLNFSDFMQFCGNFKLSETSKYLLWDELCYANILLGRIYLPNSRNARVIFELDIDSKEEDDEIKLEYLYRDYA